MTTRGTGLGLRGAWSGIRRRAEALRGEVQVLALAARDPRTGWRARLMVGLVVAYVLSPIDPIPDVIPLLGLLDELVVVPLGLAMAIRLLPPAVLVDARGRYAAGERVVTRSGVVVVAALWLAMVIGGVLVVRALV